MSSVLLTRIISALVTSGEAGRRRGHNSSLFSEVSVFSPAFINSVTLDGPCFRSQGRVGGKSQSVSPCVLLCDLRPISGPLCASTACPRNRQTPPILQAEVGIERIRRCDQRDALCLSVFHYAMTGSQSCAGSFPWLLLVCEGPENAVSKDYCSGPRDQDESP